MVFDTLTIVLSIALLLLTIVSCMMNPLFRMPGNEEEEYSEEDPKELPPLSVIIAVNDNIDVLERNIPLILAQEYEPGYQIIVVANEGDSLADDLMKRYQDNPNIQSTFIPKTSRYISREKLGVTLGVKAARNEWCVLMDALCFPESNHWLAEIGKRCNDAHNIVLGYCNYDNESKAFQRFYRLRRYAYLWREAVKGVPYCSNYSNLAFRKSDFIREDGYRGNLECVRGEYDFIVNKYARVEKTAVVTSLEGSLTEIAPTHKQWHRRRIFFIHSSKLMEHGSWHKTLALLDSLLLHLTWLGSIAAGIIAGLMQNWIVLGAAVLALLISIAWRTVIGRNAAERLHTDIPAWAVLWLELTSCWHTLADKMRYHHASKYDFTCHKL